MHCVDHVTLTQCVFHQQRGGRVAKKKQMVGTVPTAAAGTPASKQASLTSASAFTPAYRQACEAAVDETKHTGQTKRVGHAALDRELKVMCHSLMRCHEATDLTWVGCEVDIVLKSLNRLSRHSATVVEENRRLSARLAEATAALATATQERDGLRASRDVERTQAAHLRQPEWIASALEQRRSADRLLRQTALSHELACHRSLSIELARRRAGRAEVRLAAAGRAAVAAALVVAAAPWRCLLAAREAAAVAAASSRAAADATAAAARSDPFCGSTAVASPYLAEEEEEVEVVGNKGEAWVPEEAVDLRTVLPSYHADYLIGAAGGGGLGATARDDAMFFAPSAVRDMADVLSLIKAPPGEEQVLAPAAAAAATSPRAVPTSGRLDSSPRQQPTVETHQTADAAIPTVSAGLTSPLASPTAGNPAAQQGGVVDLTCPVSSPDAVSVATAAAAAAAAAAATSVGGAVSLMPSSCVHPLTRNDVANYRGFLRGSRCFARFFRDRVLEGGAAVVVAGDDDDEEGAATAAPTAAAAAASSGPATVVCVRNGVREVRAVSRQQTFWGFCMRLYQGATGLYTLVTLARSLRNKKAAGLARVQSESYRVRGLHDAITSGTASHDAVLKIRDIDYCPETHAAAERRHRRLEAAAARAAHDAAAEASADAAGAQGSILRLKAPTPDALTRAVARARRTREGGGGGGVGGGGGGGGGDRAGAVSSLPRRFRQRGVLEFLASDCFRGAWRNPYYQRVVSVKVSSRAAAPAALSALAARHVEEPELSVPFFCTKNAPGQWVEVDLAPAVLIPRAYSFASSHPIVSGAFPRSWRLEASLDGEAWTLLARHADEEAFSKLAPYATWQLPHGLAASAAAAAAATTTTGTGAEGGVGHGAGGGGSGGGSAYYRFFRLASEGPNSQGTDEFQLSCIELYGRVLCVDSESVERAPVAAAAAAVVAASPEGAAGGGRAAGDVAAAAAAGPPAFAGPAPVRPSAITQPPGELPPPPYEEEAMTKKRGKGKEGRRR